MKPHAERENESREEPCPSGRSLVAATAAVAATYAYFLIFAQFGFLHALTAVLGEGHTLLRPVLAVMGAAGIAGSVCMARIYREERGRWLLVAGYGVAAGAAGLTGVARGPELFFVSAALTGLGTGVITVGLAGMLRRETGGRRLGLCLGLGTGLAYAACNLPPVFKAGPQLQAGCGVVAAGLGLLAVPFFRQRAPVNPAGGPDYAPRGIARWVLVLLALVAYDSAVFHVIQHTPELKTAAWTDDSQLLLNAGAHLAAGLLVGRLLDGRRVVVATLGATALLGAGSLLIFAGHGGGGAPLYAAGVSLYSAVLVFYPARSGRVGLAALVYAVAGWSGSALGIGTAEQLGRIPVWLLVLVLAAGPGLLVFRRRAVQ